MRKTVFLMLMICLIAVAVPVRGEPQITGNSAVLLDARSGQVLFEKDKDLVLPPASTTKILTAIMAIESGKLDEMVTIGPNPPLTEGTRVYLVEGEKISLGELVQAALVHSANDAALAIAEFLAGSQEEFAVLMNEKARKIGATKTSFVNPHGLSQEGHATTAYDLALIGRYAMQNKTFREMVKKKVLKWEGQAWQVQLINKNELLWSYDGADGIKTGYTKEARNTIVASATREGRSYIAVVLGTSGKGVYEETAALLEYGFTEFQQLELARPGEIKASLNLSEDKKLQLAPAGTFVLSLPRTVDASRVESRVVLAPLSEEVEKGQAAGEIIYYLDGQEVGRVGLIAQNSISPSRDMMRLLLYAAAVLFFLQICWRIRLVIKRRKRRRSFQAGSYYRSY